MKMLNLREGETVIIERSPNKKNIMYEVRKKPKDKESAFTSLFKEIWESIPKNHNFLPNLQGTN